MPKLPQLIELLEAMSRSGTEKIGLSDLLDLLRKVDSTTSHVKIEINYNGREFFWTVHQRDILAADWKPSGSG
jgi:hypothetical protein